MKPTQASTYAVAAANFGTSTKSTPRYVSSLLRELYVPRSSDTCQEKHFRLLSKTSAALAAIPLYATPSPTLEIEGKGVYNIKFKLPIPLSTRLRKPRPIKVRFSYSAKHLDELLGLSPPCFDEAIALRTIAISDSTTETLAPSYFKKAKPHRETKTRTYVFEEKASPRPPPLFLPAIIVTDTHNYHHVVERNDSDLHPFASRLEKQHLSSRLSTIYARRFLSEIQQEQNPRVKLDLMSNITNEIADTIIAKLFNPSELSPFQKTLLGVTIGTTLFSLVVHVAQLAGITMPSWAKWLTAASIIGQLVSLSLQLKLLFPSTEINPLDSLGLSNMYDSMHDWLVGKKVEELTFLKHPRHVHGGTDETVLFKCHTGCLHNTSRTYSCGCFYERIDEQTPRLSEDAMVGVIDRSVHFLGSIVLVSCASTGLMESKNIIQYGNMLKAKNVIMDELIGTPKEIYKSYKEISAADVSIILDKYEALAEEGSNLVKLPMSDVLCSPVHVSNLQTYSTRAAAAIKELRKEKEGSKASHLIRLVMLHVDPLNKKANVVNDIVKGKTRIDPPAIIIAGKPGIGKTRLVKDLHKRVAALYGLPNDRIYNLAKQDGHYQFYENQTAFMVDDWLTKHPNEDELCQNFNVIFSSEPYAIPTAGLEGKTQHILSQVAYMTTNYQHNLLATLANKNEVFATMQNLRAFRDRLFWIHSDDRRINGDGRSRIHPHRRADYSHMTFQHKTFRNDAEVTTRLDSYDQIVEKVAEMMAIRELNHISLLPAEHQSADRIAHLNSLIGPRQQRPRQGRSFFVVRFQGPGDTGKTTEMLKLSRQLGQIHDIPVVRPRSLKEPPPTIRSIIVIDDLIVSRETMEDYFNYVNGTNNLAIIMIGTNKVFPYTKDVTGLGYTKSWKTDIPEDLSGLTRRFGLPGKVCFKRGILGDHCIVDSNINICVTFTPSLHVMIQDKLVSRTTDELLNTIDEAYYNFAKTEYEYVAEKLSEVIEPEFYDVVVKCKDQKQLKEHLSSFSTIMKAVTQSKFVLSDRLKQCEGFQASAFVLKDANVTNMELACHMIKAGRKILPGMNVNISLDYIYKVIGNKVYTNDPELLDCASDLLVDVQHDEIYYTKEVIGPEDKKVTIHKALTPDLVNQLLDGEIPVIPNLTRKDIGELRSAIRNFDAEDHPCLWQYKYFRTKYETIGVLDVIPAWAKVATAILAAGVVLYTVAKLFTWVTKAPTSSMDTHLATMPSTTVISSKPVVFEDDELTGQGMDQLLEHMTPRALKSPKDKKRWRSDYEENYQRTDRYVKAGIRDPESYRFVSGNAPAWQALHRYAHDHPESRDVLVGVSRHYQQGDQNPHAFSPTPVKMVEIPCVVCNKTKLNYAVEDHYNHFMCNDCSPNACNKCGKKINFSYAVKEKKYCHDCYHDILHDAYSKRPRIVDDEQVPRSIFNMQPLTVCNQPQDILFNLVEKNLVRVETPLGAYHGLMTHGTTCQTLCHGIPDGTTSVTVKFDEGQGVRSVDAKIVYMDRNIDTAILEIQPVRLFKDIRSHIIEEYTHPEEMEGFIRICTRPGSSSFSASGYVSFNFHRQAWSRVNPLFKVNGLQIALDCSPTCIRPSILDGDCGNPLVVRLPSGICKVAGLLQSDKDTKVYFRPFVQQQTPKAATAFSEVTLEDTTLVVPSALKPYIETMTPSNFESDHNKIYGFTPHFRQFNRRKNKPDFYRIPKEGLKLNFPINTAPACQNVNEVVDLSYLRGDKNGNPNILHTQVDLFGKRIHLFNPDQECFDLSRSYLKDYYSSKVTNAQPLSWPRLLNGERNPNNRQYYGMINPIELDSSCGLYFNLVHKCQKKADLFERKGNNNIVVRSTPAGNDMMRLFNEMEERIKAGQTVNVVHRCCQKQEILPIEKVKIGKTRCFINSDPILSLMQRKYTAEFVAQLQGQRTEIPPQRGCNPYLEFTELRKRLDDFEGDELEFDYSRFDRNIAFIFVWDFFDTVAAAMDPEPFGGITHRDAFYRGLARCTTSPLLACEGTVLRTAASTGIFSGDTITDSMDCNANHSITSYAAVRQFRHIHKRLPNYQEWKATHITLTGGDDGKAKFQKDLNMTFDTFAKITEELGVEVTPANKGISNEVDLFLSRNMTMDPKDGIVYPFLKDGSKTKCMHWTRDFTPEQVRDNLQTSLKELGLMSKEQYELGKQDLVKIIAALPPAHQVVIKRDLVLYDYEDIHHRWYTLISSGRRNAILDASNDFQTKLELNNQLNQLCTDLLPSDNTLLPIVQPTPPQQTPRMLACPTPVNPISWLNEWYQSHPKYERPLVTYTHTGPDHAPTFCCTVIAVFDEPNKPLTFTGSASSKKESEKCAKAALMEWIEDNMCSEETKRQRDAIFPCINHASLPNHFIITPVPSGIFNLEYKGCCAIVKETPCKLYIPVENGIAYSAVMREGFPNWKISALSFGRYDCEKLSGDVAATAAAISVLSAALVKHVKPKPSCKVILHHTPLTQAITEYNATTNIVSLFTKDTAWVKKWLMTNDCQGFVLEHLNGDVFTLKIPEQTPRMGQRGIMEDYYLLHEYLTHYKIQYCTLVLSKPCGNVTRFLMTAAHEAVFQTNYVPELINILLTQTPPEWEITLLDNGKLSCVRLGDGEEQTPRMSATPAPVNPSDIPMSSSEIINAAGTMAASGGVKGTIEQAQLTGAKMSQSTVDSGKQVMIATGVVPGGRVMEIESGLYNTSTIYGPALTFQQAIGIPMPVERNPIHLDLQQPTGTILDRIGWPDIPPELKLMFLIHRYGGGTIEVNGTLEMLPSGKGSIVLILCTKAQVPDTATTVSRTRMADRRNIVIKGNTPEYQTFSFDLPITSDIVRMVTTDQILQGSNNQQLQIVVAVWTPAEPTFPGADTSIDINWFVRGRLANESSNPIWWYDLDREKLQDLITTLSPLSDLRFSAYPLLETALYGLNSRPLYLILGRGIGNVAANVEQPIEAVSLYGTLPSLNQPIRFDEIAVVYGELGKYSIVLRYATFAVPSRAFEPGKDDLRIFTHGGDSEADCGKCQLYPTPVLFEELKVSDTVPINIELEVAPLDHARVNYTLTSVESFAFSHEQGTVWTYRFLVDFTTEGFTPYGSYNAVLSSTFGATPTNGLPIAGLGFQVVASYNLPFNMSSTTVGPMHYGAKIFMEYLKHLMGPTRQAFDFSLQWPTTGDSVRMRAVPSTTSDIYITCRVATANNPYAVYYLPLSEAYVSNVATVSSILSLPRVNNADTVHWIPSSSTEVFQRILAPETLPETLTSRALMSRSMASQFDLKPRDARTPREELADFKARYPGFLEGELHRDDPNTSVKASASDSNTCKHGYFIIACRKCSPSNPSDDEEEQTPRMAWLMAGAGLMSGLGQGLGQHGQNKHNEKMQQNQHNFDATQNQYNREHQKELQGNQFSHHNADREDQQEHSQFMQASTFAHQGDMARQQHGHETSQLERQIKGQSDLENQKFSNHLSLMGQKHTAKFGQ